MKPVGMVLATLALLGTSLFPLSASAQPSPQLHAVCTQIEPTLQRSGVSFYGTPRDGEKLSWCDLIAAHPNSFPYTSIAFDPDYARERLVCYFPIGPSVGATEFGFVWSFQGYEYMAADYCYSLRLNGGEITFVDADYT